MFLSACSAADGKSDGFFHTYFVEPFIVSIHFLAEFFNGNYGLSIILVTLIIRLLLMPFMLKQYRNQMNMKEKMDGHETRNGRYPKENERRKGSKKETRAATGIDGSLFEAWCKSIKHGMPATSDSNADPDGILLCDSRF